LEFVDFDGNRSGGDFRVEPCSFHPRSGSGGDQVGKGNTMGRQRVAKPEKEVTGKCSVLCDGQLIGAGMELHDATVFVLETQTANPEKTFKIIPQLKGGKKEVNP